MKILVFSDIHAWSGYEKVLDRIKPDVLVLAGDLIGCGSARYWSSKNPEIEKKLHVEKFYQFLKYAGEKSPVLVVKGNHDWDSEGNYDLDKINEIPECEEISGKVTSIEDLHFLGLEYDDTWYLRRLKPLIEKYKKAVDVVIMHGSRIRLVSLLEPIIIIRGGYSIGSYLVHDIPSVFNNNGRYTLIELINREIAIINQYWIGTGDVIEQTHPLTYKKYEWLKPYHGFSHDK
jgi:predicted phosphodiesterase